MPKWISVEEAAKKYTILPTLNIKWAKFSKKLTDAVPIEREKDILLDHDYDGIKERSNHGKRVLLTLYDMVAFSWRGPV